MSSTSNEGAIKVARHQDVTVIRLEGDVRLTLCLSFDQFIHDLFQHREQANAKDHSVVFDLCEAESIDSTTLGLMAKIAIEGESQGARNPIVMTSSESITRLLESMGFEDVFDIVPAQAVNFEAISQQPVDKSNTSLYPIDESYHQNQSFSEVNAQSAIKRSEDAVRAKVIEAHQYLMSMNAKNHDTFKPLVEALESHGC